MSLTKYLNCIILLYNCKNALTCRISKAVVNSETLRPTDINIFDVNTSTVKESKSIPYSLIFSITCNSIDRNSYIENDNAIGYIEQNMLHSHLFDLSIVIDVSYNGNSDGKCDISRDPDVSPLAFRMDCIKIELVDLFDLKDQHDYQCISPLPVLFNFEFAKIYMQMYSSTNLLFRNSFILDFNLLDPLFIDKISSTHYSNDISVDCLNKIRFQRILQSPHQHFVLSDELFMYTNSFFKSSVTRLYKNWFKHIIQSSFTCNLEWLRRRKISKHQQIRIQKYIFVANQDSVWLFSHNQFSLLLYDICQPLLIPSHTAMNLLVIGFSQTGNQLAYQLGEFNGEVRFVELLDNNRLDICSFVHQETGLDNKYFCEILNGDLAFDTAYFLVIMTAQFSRNVNAVDKHLFIIQFQFLAESWKINPDILQIHDVIIFGSNNIMEYSSEHITVSDIRVARCCPEIVYLLGDSLYEYHLDAEVLIDLGFVERQRYSSSVITSLASNLCGNWASIGFGTTNYGANQSFVIHGSGPYSGISIKSYVLRVPVSHQLVSVFVDLNNDIQLLFYNNCYGNISFHDGFYTTSLRKYKNYQNVTYNSDDDFETIININSSKQIWSNFIHYVPPVHDRENASWQNAQSTYCKAVSDYITSTIFGSASIHSYLKDRSVTKKSVQWTEQSLLYYVSPGDTIRLDILILSKIPLHKKDLVKLNVLHSTNDPVKIKVSRKRLTAQNIFEITLDDKGRVYESAANAYSATSIVLIKVFYQNEEVLSKAISLVRICPPFIRNFLNITTSSGMVLLTVKNILEQNQANVPSINLEFGKEIFPLIIEHSKLNETKGLYIGSYSIRIYLAKQTLNSYSCASNNDNKDEGPYSLDDSRYFDVVVYTNQTTYNEDIDSHHRSTIKNDQVLVYQDSMLRRHAIRWLCLKETLCIKPIIHPFKDSNKYSLCVHITNQYQQRRSQYVAPCAFDFTFLVHINNKPQLVEFKLFFFFVSFSLMLVFSSGLIRYGHYNQLKEEQSRYKHRNLRYNYFQD
ncbi:hypothetical protein GJ496_002673 [Pomphorhynchus laevis]|nr:hypothetical protein GJ496_002673 [Pomphorhynchus laevis]